MKCDGLATLSELEFHKCIINPELFNIVAVCERETVFAFQGAQSRRPSSMGNNASQPTSAYREAPRRTIVPFADAIAREDIGEDSDLGFFSFVECTPSSSLFFSLV